MKTEIEQEVYLLTTAIKGLADKIINSPAQFTQYDDELYEAQSILCTAWTSLRAVKRMQEINKVDNEMLNAKLKIGYCTSAISRAESTVKAVKLEEGE